MRPPFPAPQCLPPICHPFQIPPAYKAYPRNNPGKTVFPDWCILDWSFAEIVYYSTSAPNGMIGPFSKKSFVWSPRIRQEILNVSQIGKAIQGICPPFFHPDLIATVQQRCLPWLCALLSQQSHLFLICVVLTCNDSRKNLHKLCQIPRNCQCK